MQPHNIDDQCASESNPDRGWDVEQSALRDAVRLALAQVLNVANRQVHLEHGSAVNMGASISGCGGLAG